MEKLKSRKFWVAVASALFIILTEGMGIDINPEAYWALIAIVATYVLGEAYVDSRKTK